MKRNLKMIVNGSILPFLCAFAFLVFFDSCNNDDDIKSPETNAYDPTRKTFSDVNELTTFLKSISNEDGITSETTGEKKEEMSKLQQFLKYSSFDKIVNSKFEYQIGDYIYKFGESGYTEYRIEFSKYSSALALIANEKEMIKNIKNYKETSDNIYKLQEGIEVLYSGEPLYYIVDITPPDLKISADGRTKVSVGYWSKYSFVSSSAGARVEAFQLVNGNFEPYNTDLTLSWQVSLTNGLNTTGGSGPQKGTSWSVTYESYTGINVPKIDLYHGSITGACKCWDGSWIQATYQK